MSRVRDLTPTSFIVLGLLDRLGEASPYDLKQAASATVAGFWTVPHSQLYREAALLHEDGLLERREERTEGGRPRRVYSLTRSGRAALRRWLSEPAADLPELRDPGLLRLFFGADPARIAPARLAAHREQLAAYEARRRGDPGDGPRGPWRTLDAGIGHAREWVRFWKRLAEE